MSQLKRFQQLSARAILARIKEGDCSGRLLLADEVGLGKTIIAREVLENLCKNLKQKFVIYVCSSLEIAGQNHAKLSPKPDGGGPASADEEEGQEDDSHVDRLTLFPTLKSVPADRPMVFCFTPGTSLHLGHSQGMVRERAFLYALLMDVLGWERKSRNRDVFFAGRANPDGPNFQGAVEQYLSAIKGDEYPLVRKVRRQFAAGIRSLSGPPEHGRNWSSELGASIHQIAAELESKGVDANEARNYWIGQLRHSLALASLDVIQPALVILDEFQKFSDVLDNAQSKPDSLEAKLFKLNAPVLLLSATPYKAFTTKNEDAQGGSHFQNFRRTLDFLAGPEQGDRVTALLKNLDTFKTRITSGPIDKLIPREVLDLKTSVEDGLRDLILRTERYPFISEDEQGTEECFVDKGEPVGVEELKEFFALSKKARSVGKRFSMSYWKSGSYLLSFMRDYKTMEPLVSAEGSATDRHLLLDGDSVERKKHIPARNRKLNYVIEKFVRRPEAWKCLWTAPTVPYYASAVTQSSGPKKLLVFSAWRFVPDMIGAMASHEAEVHLHKEGKYEKGILNLTRKGVVAAFYPSLFLADIEVARPEYKRKSVAEMRDIVKEEIRKGLAQRNFKPGENQTDFKILLHQIEMADIGQGGESLKRSWEAAELDRKGDGEEMENEGSAFDDVRRVFISAPKGPLLYTEAHLEALTSFCLGSPGVAAMRALMRLDLWEKAGIEHGRACAIRASYQGLRNFFNRQMSQRTVTCSVGGRSSYVERMMSYCTEFQIQAVLDEFLFVVRDSNHDISLESLCAYLEEVLSVRDNRIEVLTQRNGVRDKERTKVALHIARRFGEIATADKEAETKKNIRQAFNSPFWPFILATTSVGQEGLDFHLYCRNILHWNLSSNPVDFEQREGRINRYNCLAVREALAKRGATFEPGDAWNSPYAGAKRDLRSESRSSLELFPNWIFPNATIVRTVLPYPFSSETRRYRDLTLNLSIYRLALGHPRQEELLREIRKNNVDQVALKQNARALMLNLMPFDKDVCLELSREEARTILNIDGAERERRIEEVLIETRALLEKVNVVPLRLAAKVKKLMRFADREEALAALIYFVNPFDGTPDFVPGAGFEDDEEIVDVVLKRVA